MSPTDARAPLLLPAFLLLQLLLLQAPPALGDRHLSDCPRGSLTLNVPEDLPVGSTLFSWDPDRLAVTTNFNRHRPGASRAALSRASPGVRDFFGIDFAFSTVPGQPRLILTMPLPAAGSDKLRSHVLLNCTSINGGRSSRFSLELRLVRIPLRLLVEPLRPRASRWAPAGTVVATVSAFSFGRRVSPDSCTTDSGQRAAGGRSMTVRPDGRITLAAPPLADDADEAGVDEDEPADWTAAVTCEWRGRRASHSVVVAPLRLWRRRVNQLQVAATYSDAAGLTDAQLRLRLRPLLLRQKGLRVRLTVSSDPASVRLEPPGPADSIGFLQLHMPPEGRHLTVSLEASDSLGSSEVTSLRVSRVGRACLQHQRVSDAPSWLSVLSAAVAASVVASFVATVACICLCRRHRRRISDVKPQFV